MDSFEFNKIAGAVLGTLLFAMGLGILAETLFSPRHPPVAGYALPAGEEAPAETGKPAAAAVPLPQLLAKADPAKGQATAKVCTSCHSFDKGGANKIGPALYGVVERTPASHEGFNYSAAMKEKGAKGEKWTFEALDAFIANPKGAVPGTAMSFAGLKEPEKRADVLAYLRTLSDSPVELPKP
ncbi:cytochrome c family protein [Alsobacter sp. SYSU M60028]|uniref:Cytochrome c family protein n=2 Tax=Alsobacter ponti TaxID=2962936 RepID=A0ABT1L9F2_9HYPH|nr:cytochrome c family protein [Alsobacter ponti]